jgi:N-acylneuraminate cytidylyltransferase
MKNHFIKKICIIPIRSKSKGIINKNVKKVGKHILAYYTLKAAIRSNIFNLIIISTDSKHYINIIKSLKLDKSKIYFHLRSAKSSTDKASTEMVICEILNHLERNQFKKILNVTLIQATSPLLKSIDLLQAMKKFYINKFDSLFSSYISHNFIWDTKPKKIKSINYNFKKRPRRQDNSKKLIIENGAFYIFKKKGFLKNNNRLFGKIGYFNMPKERSFEIDVKEDLDLIKKII